MLTTSLNIKTIFICGSIELGKDGVGDYTRRICGELIRNDIAVVIIAYNDKYVSDYVEEVQYNENIEIPIIRIPSSLKKTRKKEILTQCLQAYNPEWLNIQFVPFSFDNYGLPFYFIEVLRKVSIKKKVHVMFHELWVGMEIGASFKHYAWGKFQKGLIQRMLNTIKPKLISTQSDLYKMQLSSLGYKVGMSPLFSNIQHYHTDHKLHNTKVKQQVKCVVFGTIHQEAPVQQLVNEVKAYEERSGNIVVIQFIGRNGNELHYWLDILQKNNIKVEVLGELYPEDISKTLTNADLGISTTPALLSQKSGTVAAMLEHGLLVYCVAKDWRVEMDISSYSLPVFESTSFSLENVLLMKSDFQMNSNLKLVVNQYLDLYKNSVNG